MPRCVDCGTETPREEMYGPPDELRCRACVQRRFPTTNVPTRHRSSFFLRWPPVTLFVIIAAAFITLLYMSGAPEVDWLVESRFAIWHGEVWRFLTSVFVHDKSTPLHIVFNALWMWRLGKGIENWMGSVRFAGFFVVAAVGASAAQFLTGQGGIGLSGVVYALFGFLFVLRNEEEFAADLMPPGVIRLFVAWFFICILLTHFNWYPVANVAHGTGAVIGWLLGRAVLSGRPLLAAAGVGLLCLALTLLATLYMPWDGYFDLYKGFVCANNKDYPCAREWFELAARRLPEDRRERARQFAAWAKYRMEHGDEDDQ